MLSSVNPDPFNVAVIMVADVTVPVRFISKSPVAPRVRLRFGKA
jgi:hypothetical protein